MVVVETPFVVVSIWRCTGLTGDEHGVTIALTREVTVLRGDVFCLRKVRSDMVLDDRRGALFSISPAQESCSPGNPLKAKAGVPNPTVTAIAAMNAITARRNCLIILSIFPHCRYCAFI
ncbi:hypothetical protein AB0L10_37525 [Streptomyces flaveolus]|uniref:hypothetical protein n=1 Tax=Streptomyces flaveolus TaxID=67297 RepID=UPI003438F8DD